jgi:hypothetical protein
VFIRSGGCNPAGLVPNRALGILLAAQLRAQPGLLRAAPLPGLGQRLVQLVAQGPEQQQGQRQGHHQGHQQRHQQRHPDQHKERGEHRDQGRSGQAVTGDGYTQ